MNPLIRAIPSPLVRFFARPYVAGDSLKEAIAVAGDNLERRSLLTSLDLLAEGIDSDDIVRANVETYLEMVDAVADDPRFADAELRPTLSLKQSSYTTSPLEEGGDGAGAREAIFAIAKRAAERRVQLTVDMESSDWTDFTLETMRALHREGFTDVGTVIQTRLHRSEADLDALPVHCRIRLVIGIYQEPAERAVTDKKEMKERLLTFGKTLLERGHYVELATHDEDYVRRFVDEVVPAVGASTNQYEVQMLYGVPRDGVQKELLERGVKTRLYVPFAIGWSMAIAYLRRRLDEYPAMMFVVAKNMLRLG
ncbi:MAG: proline dehydrogenase family protein [Myxococcota bacterium]